MPPCCIFPVMMCSEYSYKFVRSAGEVQELFYQVNSLFSVLQDGSWNEYKAKIYIHDWSTLTPQIKKAIFTLTEAGLLMKAAGESLGLVDRGP